MWLIHSVPSEIEHCEFYEILMTLVGPVYHWHSVMQLHELFRMLFKY